MILGILVLPEEKGLPFKNTVGTAWIPKSFIISWKAPPSIVSHLILVLIIDNLFKDWTTSGQIWQSRLM